MCGTENIRIWYYFLLFWNQFQIILVSRVYLTLIPYRILDQIILNIFANLEIVDNDIIKM